MRLLLVDGPNLTMRAIYGMARSGLSVDGTPTGALHAFVLGLSRYVREESPSHVAVVWEGGPSFFRLAVDPLYKSHRHASSEIAMVRDSSFGLIKEFLALSSIFSVERRGYEADDLIAWYVYHRPVGSSAVILSSDKDFLQLLDPGVEQVRLSSADTPTDRWDLARLAEVHHCSPADYASALALAGDESDGVPGVPRFGIKTAVKTLDKYQGDWARTLDDPKIIEYKDRANQNRALVQLRVPQVDLVLPMMPPFDPVLPTSPTFESLIDFIERYRLGTIRSRLYGDTLWH